jgi:hypothetical protein
MREIRAQVFLLDFIRFESLDRWSGSSAIGIVARSLGGRTFQLIARGTDPASAVWKPVQNKRDVRRGECPVFLFTASHRGNL